MFPQLMTRRSELRNRVAAQWLAAGIDVLVCPAGPTVAPKLNTARYWNVSLYDRTLIPDLTSDHRHKVHVVLERRQLSSDGAAYRSLR